jgi:putative inorganic carbon (hco3(-)) transporter
MPEEFTSSTPWTDPPIPVRAVPRGQPRQPLPPAPVRRPGSRYASSNRIDAPFFLFLVINAVVFIRPTEWIPGTDSFPLYEILVVITLFAWASTFRKPAAMACPISFCAFALLPVVLLSHLTHMDLWYARHNTVDFSKRLIYFLMIIGMVNSPKRLQIFLKCITPCIIVLTLLGLMQYFGLIDFPTMRAFQETNLDQIDPQTGQYVRILRLCSVGIFNDPNDLCLILCLGLMLSLYWLHEGQNRGWRVFWIPVIAMFMAAIALTKSRGGFIAFLAAVFVFLISRFGIKRTLPLGFFVLPVLFFLFAGRQTDISTQQETAQDRIHLWSTGLEFFKSAPIFGIGMNQFAERARLVAHNSYLHCFAELGFIGGTLFLSMFVYALVYLWKLGKLKPYMQSEPLERFRPYLLATVAAYAIGYLTLSRVYTEPTYLMLGLVAVYLTLAARARPEAMPKLSWKLAGIGTLFGGLFVIGMYIFVLTFAHWGV